MFEDTINYEEKSAKTKKDFYSIVQLEKDIFSEYMTEKTLKTMILLLKK
jgi:hypothetical protein